jgi:hypothetical protein
VRAATPAYVGSRTPSTAMNSTVSASAEVATTAAPWRSLCACTKSGQLVCRTASNIGTTSASPVAASSGLLATTAATCSTCEREPWLALAPDGWRSVPPGPGDAA